MARLTEIKANSVFNLSLALQCTSHLRALYLKIKHFHSLYSDMYFEMYAVIVFLIQSFNKIKGKEECFKTKRASERIKDWAITSQKYVNDVDFLGTYLAIVEDDSRHIWYLVDKGWEGAFYYEPGDISSELQGAYFYADYSTAIVGSWKDHLLVSGRTAHLEEGNGWELKFVELEGPLIPFSPPSHYSYGVHPLQRDPYETTTVEVRQSQFQAGGEGLFAKRSLKRGLLFFKFKL